MVGVTDAEETVGVTVAVSEMEALSSHRTESKRKAPNIVKQQHSSNTVAFKPKLEVFFFAVIFRPNKQTNKQTKPHQQLRIPKQNNPPKLLIERE